MPIWEDDWARYLWEGNLISQGISPYNHPPEFFFSYPLTEHSDIADEILSRINHPDWISIYSPLVEIYFFISSNISSFSLSTIKIGYLIFDSLTFLIIRNLRGKKMALLYFLFPILIKEIYINAHFEIIVICLLATAIWLKEKRFNLFSWMVYGLALHSKFYLVVFIPYFLFRFNSLNWFSLETYYRLLLIFLFFLSGFLVPFFILEGILSDAGFLGLLTLIKFAQSFEFNSLIFSASKLFFGETYAFLFNGFLFVVFLLFTFLNREILFKFKTQSAQWMFLSFFLYLLLAPIANAWYFLILVPIFFLSFKATNYLWILVVIPQISYLTFTNLRWLESEGKIGFYNLPQGMILIEITFMSIIVFLNWQSIQILLNRTRSS